MTIGTGSFISVNIGDTPIASENGLYPLAAFKFKKRQIYVLHGPASSAGVALDWAKSISILL